MTCARCSLFLTIAMLLTPGILLAQFGGCGHFHPDRPVPTCSFDSQIVRPDVLRTLQRIAIVGIENNTRVRGLEHRLQTQISAALREQGRFDVADVASAFRQPCHVESVLRSEYPIQVLADCWRHYHADAVLFARINEFRPYQPLALGITIHLVDTRNAALLSTTNNFWSLEDPAVAREYQLWLARRYPSCTDLNVYLHSPAEFTNFVIQRITAGLK